MKNLFVNYWGTKTLVPPALLLLNCFLGNASIWTAIGDFWQFLPKLLGQEIFVIAVTGSNQRISPIQSRSLRRDWEFLTLNLRLRDETEKKYPPISGIETRSRFIIFILRLRDEIENSLHVISVFEMRMRILKVAIFPWNQAWEASLFCVQFMVG